MIRIDFGSLSHKVMKNRPTKQCHHPHGRTSPPASTPLRRTPLLPRFHPSGVVWNLADTDL